MFSLYRHVGKEGYRSFQHGKVDLLEVPEEVGTMPIPGQSTCLYSNFLGHLTPEMPLFLLFSYFLVISS